MDAGFFTSSQRKHGELTTIYLSGQVSVNRENKIIGEDDLPKQADQAFRNLQLALGSAGATTSDVVKITIYVKNYKPDHSGAVGSAYRRVFPFENLPAGTCVGVAGARRSAH